MPDSETDRQELVESAREMYRLGIAVARWCGLRQLEAACRHSLADLDSGGVVAAGNHARLRAESAALRRRPRRRRRRRTKATKQLAACDRTNAALLRWARDREARVGELAAEVEAMKAARHKAGKKRDPDAGSDRTMGRRKAEAIAQAAEAERQARQSDTVQGHGWFEIIIKIDD